MIKIDGFKKLAVFGLGRAGNSTCKALSESKIKTFAWDDNELSRDNLANLNLNDVTIEDPKKYNWSEIEALILAPGVPLTHPKPHYVVDLANENNVPIICDIELLYRSNNNQSKFVGITGTNGKSTTTSLIGHIINGSKRKCQVGGNIGVPALQLDHLEKDGAYILEMSSYQLDLIDKTKFNISVLLNITPDHLDRHGGMEGYIAAKARMYNNQGRDDIAIVSVDDAYCKSIYKTLVDDYKIGTVIPIAVDYRINQGISIIDGVVYNDIEKGNHHKVELGNIKRLKGKHNAQNIVAAYAVCNKLGVSDEEFVALLHNFAGLKHRMQFVAEIEGVVYINDSKATNSEAASKALAAYDNIYWIAGGVAKEGGIVSLREFFPKIKKAYLIGNAKKDFSKTLDPSVSNKEFKNLEEAFKCANEDAFSDRRSKPVVLLSPACASFDQWSSFEERGDFFCSMVEELVNK